MQHWLSQSRWRHFPVRLLVASKASVNDTQVNLETGLIVERDRFHRCFTEHDFREGVRAFVENDAPISFIDRNSIAYSVWLNMDSSQFARLGHQKFQQGSEQAFASAADVVHELEKRPGEQQFCIPDGNLDKLSLGGESL